MVKRVYTFGEGNKEMKSILGGKGANLSEMTNLGLNVPPGFTITTSTCNEFFKAEGEFPKGLWSEILEHIKLLEDKTGK
ncbi:MAG: PEP/pyruvate-binding domain-containing protein, partial [Candidatus Bathyarchaeota archaeon]